MERAFVCRRFSQIGSLYYKEDVEPALQGRPLYAEGAEVEDDDDASVRFRIGPYVDWEVWRGTRANLEADRGPCMCFIFSISIPLIVNLLRARCLVVCTSYHQYPTKMAQTICSSTIHQRAHVSLYTRYLARLPYSSPRPITRSHSTRSTPRRDNIPRTVAY